MDIWKYCVMLYTLLFRYQISELSFMLQGFLPVEALVVEVEAWGLGGRTAKDIQTSYKKREQLFTDQRRKVIYIQFKLRYFTYN